MKNTEKEIRCWMIFFMAALFVSGLTAIPLETGIAFVAGFFPLGSPVGEWLEMVHSALQETNRKYPFLAYGYDWLAFAHFVLAILFIGPLRNPVKNKWVIEFGIIACVLIIPFAFIAGHYRGIPTWWRLVDCSFGVVGLIPLAICLKKINQLERNNNTNTFNYGEFITDHA